MRLLRDEHAYHQIVEDFVEQRVDARAFIVRFQKLWDCDGAEGVDGVLEMQHAEAGAAGLYHLLNSVSALCMTYVRNLPAGAGYRVSEEQFRKEVGAMTSAWLRVRQSAGQRELGRPM